MKKTLIVSITMVAIVVMTSMSYASLVKIENNFNIAGNSTIPNWLSVYGNYTTMNNGTLSINGCSAGLWSQTGLVNPEKAIKGFNYYNSHHNKSIHPTFLYMNPSSLKNYKKVTYIDLYTNYSIRVTPIIPFVKDHNKTSLTDFWWVAFINIGFSSYSKNPMDSENVYAPMWIMGYNEATHKFHAYYGTNNIYYHYKNDKFMIDSLNIRNAPSISVSVPSNTFTKENYTNYFVELSESVHLTYIYTYSTGYFIVNVTNEQVSLYQKTGANNTNYTLIKTDIHKGAVYNGFKIYKNITGTPLIEIHSNVHPTFIGNSSSQYATASASDYPMLEHYNQTGQFTLSGFYVKIHGYSEKQQSTPNTQNKIGSPETLSYLLTGIIGVGMVVGDAYIFRKYP